MEIKILGTGCAKCKKLENLVQEVIREQGVDAVIEKVTDIKEIAKAGVMMTPGMMVDGTVKVSGKLPSKEEISKIITTSMS